MTIEEFYNERGVGDKERILAPKNIMFILPDAKFDISSALKVLGLVKQEVCLTWPKANVSIEEEYAMVKPKLAIQLGTRTFRKFHFLPADIQPDDPGVVDLKKVMTSVSPDAFVNLHHHDEFSLKDGLGTVAQLAKLLQAQRRSFCCVTNHGSVSGWIKQHNICRKTGLKAIYGMEAYVSNYRGDDPAEKKKHRSANHLVLLAKTKEGFDNIIRIHNDAQLNGFYYTPRCNWDAFKQWGKGIIATSACAAGEIAEALMADNEIKALEIMNVYLQCFDEFYIEIQIIEFEYQKELNRRLIQFAQKYKVPVIMAVDSHYLKPEHTESHDMLLLMRQKKTLLDKREKEEDIWNFEARNIFYRNEEQVRTVFEGGYVDKTGTWKAPFKDDVFTEEVFTQALRTTLDVARRCEDIKLDSTVKLPKLYDDSRGVLRKKVNEGFRKLNLGSLPNAQEYRDRVNHEFEVIDKLGWCDYFLVMERIISDTVEKFGEFSVGWGRGCFHPSMRVITGNGMPKFIGDIKKGDVVISHDGSKQKVIDTFSYDVDEELLEIEMNDGRIMRVTPEHGIFVYNSDGVMIEKKAQDLQPGDDVIEV